MWPVAAGRAVSATTVSEVGTPSEHEPACELGRATWTEIEAATARGSMLLIIPVGSCEQHGPHLPLDTDTRIATEVAQRVARQLERQRPVLVAPAIPITASGEHQGFPGTLSIGNAAMTMLIIEMIRSANWAAETVLVNGHGGNRAAIDAAVAQLQQEGHRITTWWPSIPSQIGDQHLDRLDLHAGLIETSIIAALEPSMVRADHIESGPDTVDLDLMLSSGIAAVSANGVIGDPTAASASLGEILLALFVEQLLAALSAAHTETPQDR